MKHYALDTLTPEMAGLLEELSNAKLDLDPTEHGTAVRRLEVGYVGILEALEQLPIPQKLALKVKSIFAGYREDM